MAVYVTASERSERGERGGLPPSLLLCMPFVLVLYNLSAQI